MWHTGHSNHYLEWERCKLMFRPLTYVTVLMSLICLLFWSYHYSNPMVQYDHSTHSALWPINHKTELKNPTAGNCATFLHRVLIYLGKKKLYERPVRPLCKQVPLFNYWSKKESGKTPGKDTKLQKVTESSNMICVDSLGFAVLRHFCCHSNGKHYVMHKCFSLFSVQRQQAAQDRSTGVTPKERAGDLHEPFSCQKSCGKLVSLDKPHLSPSQMKQEQEVNEEITHLYIDAL